jgi:hypothetical protein
LEIFQDLKFWLTEHSTICHYGCGRQSSQEAKQTVNKESGRKGCTSFNDGQLQ